ncbi:MAG TPA: hypothetical protein VGK30_01480 [Candidatus Binatia bacterium]
MRIGRRGLWTVVGAFALALATPAAGRCEQASFTLYGGLFGNKEYVEGWEGVQAAVGVHEYVSLLARVTGVHILDSDRFREGDSGIGEGGLGFTVAPNTSIAVLGGSYFGDIFDPVIEGDFSTAQLIGDRWLYLQITGIYGFESTRWQNTVYLSTPISDPAKDVVLFGGVESYLYNEGQLRRDNDFVRNPDHGDVKVQVGGVLAVYKRSWDAGLKLGCGGGDYGVYGTMSVFKTFTL